jgi:RNA polymerase sigma-70 factor (ECF subfamily)
MPTAKQQVFLDLLEPVYPRLSRFALSLARSVEEAEDLTSATVLEALERFDTVNEHAKFAGFLFTIASRLHKRKTYRERFRRSFDNERAEAIKLGEPLPDHAAEIRIVMDAIGLLPEKVKETLLLFEVADLSLNEIRIIQGGSISGVKSRLKRGRESVQRALGIVETSVASKKNTMQDGSVERSIKIPKLKDYAL